MNADSMKEYWKDPYVFTFEAEIIDSIVQDDRIGVIFNQTYFYPEGGGQPSDHGTIGSYPVIDIQESEGTIIHFLKKINEIEKTLVKGKRIACEIDRDYRINNMRLHTSCHLLFGAASKLFSEVNYAGFNIGEIGNLYLETPNQIRADDLRKMSLMANRIVVENHPVKDFLVDRDSVGEIDDIAFNIKLPDGQVRVIEIENWDTAACSGTHVKNTIEIGPIKILAREIHKKNVTRIDYAVGERAVEEFNLDEKILAKTSDLLSASKDSLYQIVQKNSSDLQAVQKDIKKLSEKLIDFEIRELKETLTEINGICLIIGVMDFLDAGACKTMALKILTDSKSTVTAILGKGKDAVIAAGCSSDLDLDISSLIIKIVKSYGGGGGGKPSFIMAGGMTADIDTIRETVEKELTALLSSNR